MNRREFLKTLAGAVAVAISPRLASSETESEELPQPFTYFTDYEVITDDEYYVNTLAKWDRSLKDEEIAKLTAHNVMDSGPSSYFTNTEHIEDGDFITINTKIEKTKFGYNVPIDKLGLKPGRYKVIATYP